MLRGARGNRTLVELNFWPVEAYQNWTGDGVALMRNALKFSRCMPCGPGTFASAGEARLKECLHIGVGCCGVPVLVEKTCIV